MLSLSTTKRITKGSKICYLIISKGSSNTCKVRRVIEYAYCIRTALLIKTMAMEANPYATAANKLRANKTSVMEAIMDLSIIKISKSEI